MPEQETSIIKNSLEVPLGIVNFADLKQLIFKSFIQLKSEYKNSFPIIFKSLNDNEIHRIKALAGNPESVNYNERVNLYYFLYSIYSINNINILSNRETFINEMLPFLKSMHPRIFNNIMNELFRLGQRVNEAVKLVERYSLEPDSRWLWMAIKNLPLNSADVTGIIGTEKLGYNICQLLWTYFNRREDEKSEFERMWACSKLIASVINPKAVQKLNTHEENRKIEEKNRREAIIYGKEYKPRFKIQSREELVEELEKQMLGEKDEHDKIIEEHMKRVKYKEIEKIQEITKRRKELSPAKNSLLDYNEEELQKQFEKIRQQQLEEKELLKRNREQMIAGMDESNPALNVHYAAQQLTEEDLQHFAKDSQIQNLIKDSGMLKNFLPQELIEQEKQKLDPSVFLRKYKKGN